MKEHLFFISFSNKRSISISFTGVYQLLTLTLLTFWARYSFMSEAVLHIFGKRIMSSTTFAEYQNDEICVVILEEDSLLIAPISLILYILIPK